MENVQLTYDDVMLDWAVTELLSPSRPEWSGAACDELRAKLDRAGIDSLSADERTSLIGALIRSRDLMIYQYGPQPSWSFQRVTVSCEELSRYSIIRQFGYPSFSFGDLASKIKDNPTSEPGRIDEAAMRRSALAMLDLYRSGEPLHGLPIAISRQASHKILIEGYKRSMVALWANRPSIQIHLGMPVAAGLLDPAL
jgi:hypothetical protein